MKDDIANLPELKLAQVSDKLDSPNVLIAEMGDTTQVLTFDDMWPQSNPMRAAPDSKNNDVPRRVFNGDTAIGGTLLTMSQPPVATVVFVYFTGEVPERMRQWMPPARGSIPYEILTELRATLAKNNLTVKEWNLAKQDEPPEPAKGTHNIYIFLPPPPALPVGPQQPNEQFGEKHLKIVNKLLDSGAKGIFLCKWEPPVKRAAYLPAMEGKYGYADLLRDKYGVDTACDERTIYAVLESRAGKYGVNVQRWVWMPMNNFSDMPVGKPLQGRRVLMTDVCPVYKADKVPDGIKVLPLLYTPSSEEYWATKNVMDLVRTVVSEKQGGLIDKGPTDRKSPYSVAVAVENSKDKPVVAVLGTGGSVIDGYLKERVPRFGDRNQSMRYDPAPTANADLVVNTILWLCGKTDLIGAGPVILPPVRPVPPRQMAAIDALVWGFLPGLVILCGTVMYVVRRR